MKKIILLLFFILGFFSLVSQTLIVREFIISFGGNELGIGLFYFFWLFWVGVGAISARKLNNILNKHFLKILFVYPLLSFLQVILFITLKSSAKINWWEFFSLDKIFIYLFLFTAALSFFTGIIFTLAAYWLKNKEKSDSKTITYAYIFESLGSFIAGCLVTLFIVKFISPFIILSGASLLYAFVVFHICLYYKNKSAAIVNFLLAILFLLIALSPVKIHNFLSTLRLKNIFAAATDIKEIYTPYQHVFIGQLDSQLLVISNGQILASYPEVITADRETALVISQNTLPKNILIFGYGVENLIASLLKFPVDNITYCLEDKVYYENIYRALPDALKLALDSRRVNIVFNSPRIFLKNNTQKFTLAIVYTNDPNNLVTNAFFTKEFYRLVQDNLSNDGFLATRITSGENFQGNEVKNYGASVYYTLKEVFPKIIVAPGDTNWFFAGQSKSEITDDPLVLANRLQEIIPAQFSFLPESFKSIFIRDRIEFTRKLYEENTLFKKTQLVNSDKRPLTFLLNILMLGKYSNSYLAQFFQNIYRGGFLLFFIPVIIFILMRFIFLWRIENIYFKRQLFNIKLFQFFSGFIGFSFQLILIFLFQNHFGTIFHYIGLVNALFMLGLCLGGIVMAKLLKKYTVPRLIIFILISQIVIMLLGYQFFVNFNLTQNILFFIFILFFLFGGILTGSSYPLCAKGLEEERVQLIENAADLELLDHFGGGLAGLLTGLIMLPFLGVLNNIIIISLIGFIITAFFLIEEFFPKILAKEHQPIFLSFPYIRTSYVLFSLVIVFLFSFHHLSAKKNLVPNVNINDQACVFDEKINGYICDSKLGKEYQFESKNFAPDITGFGGPLNLHIKTDSQGVIKEVKILEHSETSGYIDKIEELLTQFKQRSLSQNFSSQNIDAISGATITSSAVIDIINAASKKIISRFKDLPQNQSQASPKKIIFDQASIWLLGFVILAVILYTGHYKLIFRRIYLIAVVLILGVMLNLNFSLYHLSNVLMGKIFSFSTLSHILLCLLPLSLGVLFGQFWCGWLCPVGAIQELLGQTKLCRKISPDLENRARYFKYIFLTFVILVVTIFGNVNLFKQEPLSVLFLNPFTLNAGKILATLILFFSIFYLRFWCRYFCPCGAALSLFNKFAILRKFFPKFYKNCSYNVKGPKDVDCIQCNLCLNKADSRG